MRKGPCLIRSKKVQTDVHVIVQESEKQRDLIIFCIQNAEQIMELVPPIDFQRKFQSKKDNRE